MRITRSCDRIARRSMAVPPSPPAPHDEYWAEVERLFSLVVGGDPDTVASTLETACAGRPDLRREVESLLAAHGRAATFLSDPTNIAGVVEAGEVSRCGQRVGAFTLVELIAAGGMGAVYRAERVDHDFTQQVAVKLMSAPMGHPEAARRFRAERQILAALHHPHIVTLLDGGITTAAEAYLVMEYVDGVPLSTYCERHALSLRARLELFRDVCGAVQYLHQNLVIHRDLKPSNI